MAYYYQGLGQSVGPKQILRNLNRGPRPATVIRPGVGGLEGVGLPGQNAHRMTPRGMSRFSRTPSGFHPGRPN